jgi:FixJ family two-component response regulator
VPTASPHSSIQKPPPNSLVCLVGYPQSVDAAFRRVFDSVGVKVESFGSVHSYHESPLHEGPTCLVLDFGTPASDAIDLANALKDRGAKFVSVTNDRGGGNPRKALKAGAIDVLFMPVKDELLLKAVNQALILSARVRLHIDLLTERQLEVLTALVAGKSIKEIGSELGLSVKTIATYRALLMDKLGARSLADLIRLAFAAGVIGNRTSDRTDSNSPAGEFSVFIDLGSSSAEEIAGLFTALAELQRACGGFGISIRDDGTRAYTAGGSLV